MWVHKSEFVLRDLFKILYSRYELEWINLVYLTHLQKRGWGLSTQKRGSMNGFKATPHSPPPSLSRRIIADVEILIATVAPVFCCHPRPELFLSELEIGSRHVLKQLPRQLRDSNGFCFFQQTRQSAGINNFRVKSWLHLFFRLFQPAEQISSWIIIVT